MRILFTTIFCLIIAVNAAFAQNAIVAENQIPGNPASEWDLSGPGSTTLQGFTTDISVNHGSTVNFKIQSGTNNWRIDIYRLGYYQGNGARLITTINKTSAQTQPAPITNSATGEVDAGNWSVTASWAVPASAVSGVYIAHLVDQTNTSNENHIPFIVRADEFDQRHPVPDFGHDVARLQRLGRRQFLRRQWSRRGFGSRPCL